MPGLLRCGGCIRRICDGGRTYTVHRLSYANTTQRWHATNPSALAESSSSDVFTISKSFAVGSLAGICGSLAGMGGGFIMIPLLTSRFLRLSQHQAHGTSLFAVAATGVAGAMGYQGEVHLETAAAVAGCAMFTARFGANMTSYLSSFMLRRSLGIFMLFVAPIVPIKAYLQHLEDQGKEKSPQDVPAAACGAEMLSTDPMEPPALERFVPPALIGLGSGFLSGLFGVGGGAIVVPALAVATDMNHYQALGTSLCAMALPATVGTVTHFGKGNVAMRVAPALAFGAFVGAYCGSRLGLNFEEESMRWGFSGLMVMLGAKALLK